MMNMEGDKGMKKLHLMQQKCTLWELLTDWIFLKNRPTSRPDVLVPIDWIAAETKKKGCNVKLLDQCFTDLHSPILT